MKISNFMIYILSAIFGFGICLIIFNLQNTSKCEKGSPNELEKYSEILANKLKLTEKQLKKNNLQLNTLLRDLQHKLLKLDAYDVDAIMKSSQDEAVRLALMLKDRPAPPMPYFESNSIYDQQLEGGMYPTTFQQGFSVDDDKYIDDQWKELLGSRNGDKNDDNFLLKDDKVEFASKNADDVNKIEKEEVTMTDAEATAQCTEWKTSYNVIVGVSWGTLPFDLQKKWLEISCDYHLSTS